MASWDVVAAAEPDFADRVRALFDAHRHKTMATLRRDGSPRISGIEVAFGEGEVFVGMGPDSVKAADVARDSRVAIHSASDDPPEDDPSSWPGDAKLAGRAIPMPDPEHPEQISSRYRIDIDEVVLTKVGRPADHLAIESWHQGRGYRPQERR